MGDIPETRYAKTGDGAHIAFQVLGDGPPDLVFLAEGASHLELGWDIPAYESVFRRLASFSRLILFDTRGSGLSDPLGLSEQLSLEVQTKDMLAVLDAAGAERGRGGEQRVGTAGYLLRRFLSEPHLLPRARRLLCAVGPSTQLRLRSAEGLP